MSSTPIISEVPLLQAITLRASAQVGVLTPALNEEPMKRVFVSSRYRGDYKRHVADAIQYCQFVEQRGGVPLCPTVYFTTWRLTPNPVLSLELLSVCDEIWLFVTDHEPKLSDGMKRELNEATELGLRIRFYHLHNNSTEGGVTIDPTNDIVSKD